MPALNKAFGEAVLRVLDEHNLSFRAQRNRTGLDHVTVSSMAQGIVPRMDNVVKFARGFGLPVGDWLELAGYDRLEEANWMPGAARLLQGLEEIAQEFPDYDIPIPRFTGTFRELPLEDAEMMLQVIRERLREQRRREWPTKNEEGEA